jgi:7-carboxy-7-deazaguanine synthase
LDQPLDILAEHGGLKAGAASHTGSALPVSEVFTSIQGEGTLTGVVSHFIRLSGCNLRCRWCDTPYASWTPDGATMSIEAIVAGAKASGARHVVVTGGEPMIFPGLNRLTRELHAAGLHITIETAGTVLPPEWLGTEPSARGVCDLYSVSPKLSTSTPVNDARDPSGVWAKRHEERRINLEVLQALLDACARDDARPPAYQLKFVVCDERDVAEIRELLGKLWHWTPDRVLLMPEGTSAPTPEAKARVVKACMEHGFRYCTRLHIDLFGNARGT